MNIGRYHVVRELGQGGMASVYEACESALNRRVAIKVLHADMSKDAEVIARFVSEGRIVNGIRHLSLVPVHEQGQLPDGSYYIHGSYHGYDDGMVNDTAQRMVSRLYGLDVGVQEDKALTTVKVYPNPASGSFRLEGLVPGEPTEVVVYDGLGKAVRAWRLASAGAEFDVRALMPGLYTLRVAQEDKALGFIKLIIQ